MKNLITTKILVFSLSIMLLFGSCERFLTEEPHSFLAPENYYQTEDDAFSALVGVYNGLGSSGVTFLARTLHYITWFPSDEASTFASAQRQLDNFQYNAANPEISSVWTQMYIVINRANVFIDRFPQVAMDEEKKSQFIAEARFVRALAYFYGVRLWGGIPLIVNEVKSVDEVSILSRASAASVYEQVVLDLNYAAENLPPINQEGRATLGAAKALLAKVYLTRASSEAGQSTDYQNCASLAAEVIAMPNYNLLPDFQQVFGPTNEFNEESIFEWQADRVLAPSGVNSIFGHFMLPRDILGFYPEADQAGEGTIFSEIAFFNLFNENDYSKESTFITEGTNRQGQHITWQQFTYPYPHAAKKYIGEDGLSRNERGFSANFMILRLADVYLMRAEALNEVDGPTQEAYEMVNALRRRARNRDGSPSLYPEDLAGLTKDGFRDAVLNERAFELAFEGHRWFDLVRTKRLIETIKSSHPEYPISEKHYLFPIPADELIINSNLTQNPGW